MSGAGRTVEGNRPPRAYLRSDERRRQLLESAAQIAGSEGVDRLTIVGLAKAAGVSRQLVYDHFSDLQGLVRAMLAERFRVIDNAIYAAITRPDAHESPQRERAVALEAARGFLELPAGDRHVLRSVLSATDTPGHELHPLALQLRARSIRRWLPFMGGERADAGAEARTWALVNALAGIGDLVGTGELGVEEGLEQFELLLRATLAAGRGTGPRAASAKGRARRPGGAGS